MEEKINTISVIVSTVLKHAEADAEKCLLDLFFEHPIKVKAETSLIKAFPFEPDVEFRNTSMQFLASACRMLQRLLQAGQNASTSSLSGA